MIPLEHGLILAAILFVMGLSCLVIRRNLLFMLIGLEIMINSTALAFVVAGSFGAARRPNYVYIGNYIGCSGGEYWIGVVTATPSSSSEPEY